ncbi:MAG TPA: alpha/beta hydrolase [Nocardiopsis listeri]|uniref:alpha/beta hydrolase n=1 Tax=Nocardiopsis listeri TaxID=53440 RepID=UPI001D84724E|nr:alpha/beta hydrolase [Nocardiopsis listeri]HJE57650.1 alpha/beta hydrolase [Nocardiopsis listeri]
MDLTRVPPLLDLDTARATLARRLSTLHERTFDLPEDAVVESVPAREGACEGTWISTSDAPARAGAILYLHGGGFHHRMPDLMNLFASHVSRATGLPVFVAHYRLAPAHTFPAPLHDAVAAYRCLLDQGVPAGRVVVLSESSGGTLALSMLLELKAAGVSLPASVISYSPPTDLTLSSPSVDTNTAHDPGVDREMLTALIGGYLDGARPDQAPQSPLFGDLTGLPPLLLAVGEDEALLDDTLRLAKAADEAGGPVTVRVYEAMSHAFQAAVIDRTEDPTGQMVLEHLAEWVRASLPRTVGTGGSDT